MWTYKWSARFLTPKRARILSLDNILKIISCACWSQWQSTYWFQKEQDHANSPPCFMCIILLIIHVSQEYCRYKNIIEENTVKNAIPLPNSNSVHQNSRDFNCHGKRKLIDIIDFHEQFGGIIKDKTRHLLLSNVPFGGSCGNCLPLRPTTGVLDGLVWTDPVRGCDLWDTYQNKPQPLNDKFIPKYH